MTTPTFPDWDEITAAAEEADRLRRFACVDCGMDTISEYYMVSNELWAAAGMTKGSGMLCLACLEKRIGRDLAVSDFVGTSEIMQAWNFEAWELHKLLKDGVSDTASTRM